MSKVAFVEDAKAAYISCPLKMVVDLSKTKMDPCIEPPAPTATIAGSSGFDTNQFFDVTALIQEVHETHHYENKR